MCQFRRNTTVHTLADSPGAVRRMSMNRIATCWLFILAAPLSAQEKIAVTITGGKEDATNVPICVPLELPKDEDRWSHLDLEGNDMHVKALLTAPSITTESIAAKGDRVRLDLN